MAYRSSRLLTAALLASLSMSGPSADPPDAEPETVLEGRVLLPPGTGSRGVEVVLKLDGPLPDARLWAFLDERGHFARSFRGTPASVQVMAGAGREVHRIDAGTLRELRQGATLDVGVIDLRERLVRHRFVLRAAEGSPPGDVRVAMWRGLPPRGPGGETVSLGSRQFPPVALESELEWLLPPGAESIYFLVERPADANRGTRWRSGRQRLFGPFTSASFPAELSMD